MLSILDPKWHVFRKVAQLESLTRAAHVLDVPQSMVSRHIAHLEKECGSRLFRRTGRGVLLTDFGEQILIRLEILVKDIELLEDNIRTSKGNPIGEVRVGLLPSTVPVIASYLFSTVTERYPLVKLHLIEGASAQLEEQLKEGRIDMALLLREGNNLSPHEKILSQTRLRIVGKAGEPLLDVERVPLRALDGLPLVLPSRPHPLRAHLDLLSKEHNIELRCENEADSIHLQFEVVAAGGGYAVTSGLLELWQDKRLNSAIIIEPELVRSVVLSSTLRRPGTLATRKVQEIIEKDIPALLNIKK